MLEQVMMRSTVDSRRFVGKVAVITGAAGGIGGACALRFAQEGANIACLDIATDANERMAAQARDLGIDAVAIACDVADVAAVEAAFSAVAERWGGVDIVVAAAGVYTGSSLEDVPDAEWLGTLATNLTGAFYTNRAAAPYLRKRGAGSIVNISSMAGKTSWPGSAEYSASKSGLIGLTRSVAMELAPHGVTVNAVCPGNTLTGMVRHVAAIVGGRDGMDADEWLALRTRDCPLGRIAQPWEIAGVVAFLASEDSRYLTGQALEVDGGMVMA